VSVDILYYAASAAAAADDDDYDDAETNERCCLSRRDATVSFRRSSLMSIAFTGNWYVRLSARSLLVW